MTSAGSQEKEFKMISTFSKGARYSLSSLIDLPDIQPYLLLVKQPVRLDVALQSSNDLLRVESGQTK